MTDETADPPRQDTTGLRPQAPAGTSPLRWLLVIVPLLVIAGGSAYLASSLLPFVRQAAYEEPAWLREPPAPGPPATAPQERVSTFNVDAVMALLGEASAEDGAKIFKMCAVCHAAEKGGPVRIGNPLWGIVGQRKAAHPGFNYSRALRAKGGTWTYRELALYLHNPRTSVPGTSMAFAGIVDNYRMADLLAYLRTLSDTPMPLPK